MINEEYETLFINKQNTDHIPFMGGDNCMISFWQLSTTRILLIMVQFDVNTETVHVVLFIIIGIYWFIITPIQIFYGYRFWKLKQQNIAFFTKRHASLVISNAIMFNLYPLIFRPISDLILVNGFFPIHHPAVLMFSNLINCYALLIVMRLWLLYYDFNHELHSLSLKWKSQITKHGNHTQLPWTMRYKWMGNPATISIFAGIMAISLLAVAVLSSRTIYTLQICYTTVM